MTVQQLIDKLQKIENKSLKVILQVDEDQGTASGVSTITEDDCPYCKGDNMWSVGDLDEGEEACMIS